VLPDAAGPEASSQRNLIQMSGVFSAGAVVGAQRGDDDRPMRERARQILPWALLGLTVAVGAVGIWLDAVSDGPEAEWGSYVFPVAVAMSSGVGFVLATRRRENPIGWLLLANG
jgi:hypothetical protein